MLYFLTPPVFMVTLSKRESERARPTMNMLKKLSSISGSPKSPRSSKSDGTPNAPTAPPLAGTHVWVPATDKADAFVKAYVTDYSGGRAIVTINGTPTSVAEFYPYDERDELSNDLVQMLNVDQPNMLHTLAHRHAQGDNPYTNVGQESILISVNPYRIDTRL